MIHKLTLMLLFLCCTSMVMAINSAEIRITKKDNSVITKKVVLQKLPDGVSKLIIKKEDIPTDAKFLDVLADNARAKKGEKGFWLFNQGSLGHFIRDNGALSYTRNLMLPYYAMQTERETFIAIFEGMRFEAGVFVIAKNGEYKMFPRWDIANIDFPPYQDIEITYYTLPLNADYNQMAKTYRKHKLAKDPEIKTIKERYKTQPLLKKNVEAFSLRMRFAEKDLANGKGYVVDYTPETEPKIKTYQFSDGTALLHALKIAGLENLFVSLEGWQNGGWGGRTPSIWPICEEAGGEKDFVKLVKTGQSFGYIMDVHMYYTDQYVISRDYKPEETCLNPDGSKLFHGAWAGGKAYSLCLKSAWENWIPAELEKIKRELFIEGGMFFDVFGATAPYRCCNPKHPTNRWEAGIYHKKIMQKARELFGVIGQECCMDDFISQVDFIYYNKTAIKEAVRKEADPTKKGVFGYDLVPFFELVYHDIAMSSPYRLHFPPNFFLDKNNADKILRLAEFGGRICSYDVLETSIIDIKKAYNFYKRYVHLIPEEMVYHSKIAEGVFKTDFGNGESIISNYNKTPFNYKGTFLQKTLL